METSKIIDPTNKGIKKKVSGKMFFLISIIGILLFLLLAKAFLASLHYIIITPIFLFLLIKGGKYIFSFCLFIFKFVINFFAVFIALGCLIYIFS
ncbi:hypothetical protein DES36_11939 [Alkalibaculum bacchi]|uniref:Uncharacterized protein n=1 Tax=Alkalibaculum bacchi TaxID=645887 RepID=A0A366I0X2_9FIRM|nr:hypothetical protein [Alkalibaculum bacchi]RBP59314.1 hypothetical protein DES36_11939 [Alkalibaculum bacchi]